MFTFCLSKSFARCCIYSPSLVYKKYTGPSTTFQKFSLNCPYQPTPTGICLGTRHSYIKTIQNEKNLMWEPCIRTVFTYESGTRAINLLTNKNRSDICEFFSLSKYRKKNVKIICDIMPCPRSARARAEWWRQWGLEPKKFHKATWRWPLS